MKKKVFFRMILVNILCGKSHFGKKSASFLFHLPTLKLSSEAPSEPFFDRLDIFPDAIDLKNTMAVSILVLHRPLVRSEKKFFFSLECREAETGFWIRCTIAEKSRQSA